MTNPQTEAVAPGKRPIAIRRIAGIATTFILSGVLTYFFGDALSNSADSLGMIATIFSILAGVLIAVISILGDPSMLLDQSWRHSYLSAEETQRKIHRQTDIFVVYVVLLAGLFVFMLTNDTARIYPVVQHSVFFLIVLAFMASLSLPYTLRSIQRTRLTRAIGQLKKMQKAQN